MELRTTAGASTPGSRIYKERYQTNALGEISWQNGESSLKLALENRDLPEQRNVQKGSLELRQWIQVTLGYRYLPASYSSYLADPAWWNPLGQAGRHTGSAFLSFPAGGLRLGLYAVEKSAGAGFFLVHPDIFLAVHPEHGSAALASRFTKDNLRVYTDISFFTRTERLKNYLLEQKKMHRDGEGSLYLEHPAFRLEAVRRANWDLFPIENGRREESCQKRCGKSGYGNILGSLAFLQMQVVGQDRGEHHFRLLSLGGKTGERWQVSGEARFYRYRSYREEDQAARPGSRPLLKEGITRSAALSLGWQSDEIFLQLTVERSYEERLQGRVGFRARTWNAAAGFAFRSGKEERDFLFLDTSTHPDGRVVFTRTGRSLTFLQLDSEVFYTRVLAESGPEGMSYRLQLYGQLQF